LGKFLWQLLKKPLFFVAPVPPLPPPLTSPPPPPPSPTTQSNHELPKDLPLDVNASHYVNMLGASMPGPSQGSYYSVDVGLNHLVFLTSEVIALGPYGGVTVEGQEEWLVKDLAAVNRSATPWVVAVLHRPFYCSNANSWCGPNAWQGNSVRLALEPALLAGGVDVVLAAHEHRSVEGVGLELFPRARVFLLPSIGWLSFLHPRASYYSLHPTPLLTLIHHHPHPHPAHQR
jgi:hypothetical protein